MNTGSGKIHALRIIMPKYFSGIEVRILISFLIFILALGLSAAGCAEENNPLVNAEKIMIPEAGTSTEVNCYGILIWTHEGLAIEANGERIVTAETSFNNTYNRNRKMLIIFNGWTTPDTSCYISTVILRSGSFYLYQSIGEQNINGHHELLIETPNVGEITFYIVLWHDETFCNSRALLKISDIRIYGYH